MTEKMQKGSWLQVSRTAMQRLAELNTTNPKAATTMMQIAANVEQQNALVISQGNLAKLVGCSVATLKRTLTALEDANWIEIVQIGDRGTVNAYRINSAVVWTTARDKIKYSKFHAVVIASSNEQPRTQKRQPLNRINDTESTTEHQFTIEGEITRQIENEQQK